MADDKQFDDAEFLEKLRTTSLDAAVQQLRFVHALKRGRTTCSSDPRVPMPPSRRPTEATVSDLLFDLTRLSARLSLNSYEQWLKLSAHYFDSIVDAVVAPKRTPDSPPTRLKLRAERQDNGAVKARLIIENPHPRPEEVLITNALFRCNADELPIGAELTVERLISSETVASSALRLGGGESGRFELVFRPDRPFSAERRYVGETHVIVGSTVVGQLCIEVETSQPAALPAVRPQAERAPRGPARRRHKSRRPT